LYNNSNTENLLFYSEGEEYLSTVSVYRAANISGKHCIHMLYV